MNKLHKTIWSYKCLLVVSFDTGNLHFQALSTPFIPRTVNILCKQKGTSEALLPSSILKTLYSPTERKSKNPEKCLLSLHHGIPGNSLEITTLHLWKYSQDSRFCSVQGSFLASDYLNMCVDLLQPLLVFEFVSSFSNSLKKTLRVMIASQSLFLWQVQQVGRKFQGLEGITFIQALRSFIT